MYTEALSVLSEITEMGEGSSVLNINVQSACV